MQPNQCMRGRLAVQLSGIWERNGPLVELRQASIAACDSGEAREQSPAIHLKLSVGQGVAGQRVRWEQRAEGPAVGVGVELAEGL
jgi:hypothetical protein